MTIGHNNPPPFDPDKVAALKAEAEQAADAAAAWAGITIGDETAAGRLKDHIDALSRQHREAEAARKAAKQPHLDAGRAVDDAFRPITETLARAAKIAREPLAAWLMEQERIAAERRRIEAEAARKAAEEAERMRRAAEAQRNAAAQVEAEAAAEAAAEAQRIAERADRVRVSSATGSSATRTSLRTVRRAQLRAINQALLHYRDHPEVAELLTRLANADLRAAKGAPITIPGFDIIEEKTL